MAFFLFCFLILHPRAELPLFVLTRESANQNEFLRRIRQMIIILSCYTNRQASVEVEVEVAFPPLRPLAFVWWVAHHLFPDFAKKKKPVEVRPWGELPSNSIQTNRQRVRRRTLSKCERCVPGGVEPVMSAAHGFQTHLCEVRASL